MTYNQKLANLRNQIDQVDENLLNIIAERINIVKQIGKLKHQYNVPHIDKDRWQQVINRMRTKTIHKNLDVNIIEQIYNILHEYSLNIEIIIKQINTNNIITLGPDGSYHSIVARQITSIKNIIFTNNVVNILKKLQDQPQHTALIAIHNSITGKIKTHQNLIKKYNCKTLRTIDLPIIHTLIGLKSAKLSQITSVMAHPQALKQCSQFIKKHNLITIKTTSSSQAILNLLQKKDYTVAVIAPYFNKPQLKKIADDIANEANNTTSFAHIKLNI